MDTSPFSRLSPELRDHIWALVVTEDKPYDIGKSEYLEPAITRVCTQIREECQLMFYAKNDFAAHISNRDVSTVRNWMNFIGQESCTAIKRLTLHYSCGVPSYEPRRQRRVRMCFTDTQHQAALKNIDACRLLGLICRGRPVGPQLVKFANCQGGWETESREWVRKAHGYRASNIMSASYSRV